MGKELAILLCVLTVQWHHVLSQEQAKHYHSCNYATPDYVRHNHVVDMEAHQRVKRQTNPGGVGLQANPQAIRIVSIIDPSISQASAVSIVQPAVAYFQQTLQVKYPLQTPLTVTQDCAGKLQPFANAQQGGALYCWRQCANVTYCGSYAVPSQYLGPCSFCNGSYSTCQTVPGGGTSFAADVLIFVVSLSDSTCTATSGVAAYATHCQVDFLTSRTTVIMVNVCPKTISAGSSLDLYGLRHTVMHELTHGLGFASGMFSTFLSPNGTKVASNPVVSMMMPWQTASGVQYKNTSYLTTPTVVAAVRQHFNCSSLPGAELEDQGGPGTALTHWEKRVFNNELMSGMYTDTAYMSPITLSLLQDTGWYVVNFSMAESYTWAKGLGCTFATQSCMSWIRSQRSSGKSPYPYCDQYANHISWTSSSSDIRTICDPIDYSTIRYCNLQYYSSGSPGSLYQYFNASVDNLPPSYSPLLLGGAIYLADYCPFFEQYTVSVIGSLKTYFMACSDPTNGGVNSGKTSDLSRFGSGQKCVRETLPSMTFTSSSATASTYWGAGCYTVTCGADAVTVTINNSTFVCASELQTVNWNISCTAFHSFGQFSCPLCSQACPNTTCPMAPAGFDAQPLLLNVSTLNETALIAQVQSAARSLPHGTIPSASANLTSTCPTNFTVTVPALPANSTANSVANLSSAATLFHSVVSTVQSYTTGSVVYLCPKTCSAASTCAYLATPFCRCTFPLFGNGALACTAPDLINQVLLIVKVAVTSTSQPVSSNYNYNYYNYNATVAQMILFDMLLDGILSQYVSTNFYVPTSAASYSVSQSNRTVVVVLGTQHAINVTKQASLVPTVTANVSKEITSWFSSLGHSQKTCNFGFFVANCSSIGVSVTNMCNYVSCPTGSYCIPYGQLYNCVCNSSANYLAVGTSGANPLVQNCVRINSTVTANLSGAGVNCSVISAGHIRCVCANGYAGTPSTGCVLTSSAKNILLISVQLKIQANMPESLAVASSVSYWAFVLSMEQDLNTASSNSSGNGTLYVAGSTAVKAVTNGSINVQYTASYKSASGASVNLAQVLAQNVAAIQSYYAQASQVNNGTCNFGTIQASCAVSVVPQDICATSNPCPTNSQCVTTGYSSYVCQCMTGYTLVEVVNTFPVCTSNAEISVNNGILLAIVLPCVLGLLAVAVALAIVYRVRWASKRTKAPWSE